MNKLETKTRREFLKTIASLGAVGTMITMTASGISAGLTAGVLLLDNEKPCPVYKEEAIPEGGTVYKRPKVIDKQVSNTNFKLCGVLHDRLFAQSNYATLEKLIEKSSVVVVEAAMGAMNKILDHYHVEAYHTTGAFFSTVAKLAHKYNKPLIDLDSITGRASLAEFLLGLGGAAYSIKQTNPFLKSLNGPEDHNSQNPNGCIDRRGLITSGLKMVGGAYLALSSMFSSQIPKRIFYNLILKKEEKMREHEKFYFSHTIDQRNVKITERLLELPNLLEKEDQGNYILAIFGEAHVIGANYYMDHPIQRKIKSLMYKYTYDLIDYNTITKFVPDNGSWKKIVLKE